MSQLCITLPLIVLFLVKYVCGYPGDSVMYLPPFEVRAMDTYPSQAYPSQYPVNRHKPQQVPYYDVIPKKPQQTPTVEKKGNQNITFGELFDSLNKITPHNGEEFQRFRTSEAAERKTNTLYTASAGPMDFSTKYAPPATYYSPPNPTPPSSAQPKTPLLKPDLSSILTPKVSNKMSGIMSLLPALFAGSLSGGLEKTGMKDLLINGIIKPLLVSKGGIKTLISKLTIPVIALLLINLEVLITIWWLWEDCPDIVEPTYPSTYSKPVYNYNNNSYR